MSYMPYPSNLRRRLARGISVPAPRASSASEGPTPAMDAPLSTPSECVELDHASAAIRALLAAAGSRVNE